MDQLDLEDLALEDYSAAVLENENSKSEMDTCVLAQLQNALDDMQDVGDQFSGEVIEERKSDDSLSSLDDAQLIEQCVIDDGYFSDEKSEEGEDSSIRLSSFEEMREEALLELIGKDIADARCSSQDDQDQVLSSIVTTQKDQQQPQLPQH